MNSRHSWPLTAARPRHRACWAAPSSLTIRRSVQLLCRHNTTALDSSCAFYDPSQHHCQHCDLVRRHQAGLSHAVGLCAPSATLVFAAPTATTHGRSVSTFLSHANTGPACCCACLLLWQEKLLPEQLLLRTLGAGTKTLGPFTCSCMCTMMHPTAATQEDRGQAVLLRRAICSQAYLNLPSCE